MEGIRESDRKRICFFVEKGEGDIFYEQLHQSNQLIQNEWVAQGNKPEAFQVKGAKISIILANASDHKRLDLREKIAQELPNIILEFLLAYSPDLKIIELVWHSCKEPIAH